MLEILLLYILVVILNYVFVFYTVYLSFRVIPRHTLNSFFKQQTGKNIYQYYRELQIKIVVPFWGILYGVLFIYRFYTYKSKGYSDLYCLAKAYQKEY